MNVKNIAWVWRIQLLHGWQIDNKSEEDSNVLHGEKAGNSNHTSCISWWGNKRGGGEIKKRVVEN